MYETGLTNIWHAGIGFTQRYHANESFAFKCPNSKAYSTNYRTKVRHVCAYLNGIFLKSNPNNVMLILSHFWKFCGKELWNFGYVVCSSMPGQSAQITQLNIIQSKAAIGLTFALHCKAIAAFFFISYCRPTRGHCHCLARVILVAATDTTTRFWIWNVSIANILNGAMTSSHGTCWTNYTFL